MLSSAPESARMTRSIKLVQLPIPQMARFSASGNVPLAAGCLTIAGQAAGLNELSIEMVDADRVETMGDAALAAQLAEGEPAAVGFSLYLWNHERSLHVARAIKDLSPRTRIVIGGPEVAPDNAFLLESEAFDIAVTGEAEMVFPALLDRIAKDRCAGGLPGVAVRGKNGLSPFSPAHAPDFELTAYPSPYSPGALCVDPRRATYIETVRGCRSHCTFCFYPRSSAVLRSLDVAASAARVRALAERGAREIVFLDPTFNHRSGFDELLVALRYVRRDHEIRFFAEVRAEGLTERHADLLWEAGFHKLEIGLQSVNPRALAATRRGGSKDLVLRAAKMLEARGIDLLLDLIVGLPGDARDDVAAGIDFLADHGMGRFAQVFPLQVLPGTAMRGTAESDGLYFDRRPPYRIERTPTLATTTIEELLGYAEERFDRRLDETPRPFLCDADPTAQPPDVFVVDTDSATNPSPPLATPGAAHVALWLMGSDLWKDRERCRRAIRERLAIDPFSVLDVILAPLRPFPLDLLDSLREELAAEPRGYACRSGIFRDDPRGRRLCLVLRRGVAFPADWVAAMREELDVRREMTLDEAFAAGSRIGAALPGARIIETNPRDDESLLVALDVLCSPEDISFADRQLERAHVEKTLGVGTA